MSLVLGIFDGTHDAGACLIEDGVVIAACDEERWSRKKGQGGFPIQSIQCLTTSCANLRRARCSRNDGSQRIGALV